MEMLRMGNTEINEMDVDSVDAGEFCKNECVCVSSLQRQVSRIKMKLNAAIFFFFKFQI